MATIDELQVQITANAANFEKELGGVKKQLNSLSHSTSSMSSKMTAGFVAVGTVIGNVLTKALSAVASFADDAVTRLDTLKNFPKVMSNLGIGSDQAQKSIDTLESKLQGLPTTLDAAALAVQRFTSANGNVGASTHMFLALNNAILAGGASMEIQKSALEQMSQAYAKGKPDMMEWRTMMMAMPAQLKQVATAMGYADATALGEDLRAGKVSMNEFMATVMKLNKQGINGLSSFEQQARNATGGVQTSIVNLKTAITRGLTAIMDAIGQTNIAGFFNAVASAVGTAANYIAAFIKLIVTAINALKVLFGGTKASADSAKQSADNTAVSMGGVGDAANDATKDINGTSKAAKKLANQLAGFDEMNVLKEPDSSDGGGSGGSSGTGAMDLSGMDFDWGDFELNGKNAVDEIYERLKKAFSKLDLSKWNKAIDNFKKGAINAFNIIAQAGRSAWDNLFVPLGKYILENALPDYLNNIGVALQKLNPSSFAQGFDTFFKGLESAFEPLIGLLVSVTGALQEMMAVFANIIVPPALSAIGAVFSVIGAILDGIKAGFDEMWHNVLEPFLNWLNEIIQPVIDDIQRMAKGLQENEGLMNTLKAIGQALGTVLGAVFSAIGIAIGAVVAVITVLIDLIMHAIEFIGNLFNGIWNTVKTIFTNIGNFIKSIFDGIKNTVGSVVESIGKFFSGAWETIKNGAKAAWEGIKSVFSAVANFFGTIFSNAWNAVKAVFSTGGKIFDGIKDGIVNAFKTIVNSIITGINKVVAIPFNAINGFLNGIRSIDILGIKPFGWVGTINVPQIPLLATGGVTTGATLAMIGESGKEAVLPLEKNTGWMDTLAEKINGSTGQPLIIKIGEDTILDTIIRGINDASFLGNSSVIRI